MINLILMIVASLMAFILMPISLLYGLIRAIFHKGLSYYFWQCALSIDQSGNVICQFLFNDLMIKPNGHRCGNPDETISYVLGMNKSNGTLYPLGLAIAAILNKIDPNHVENAVKNEKYISKTFHPKGNSKPNS